MIRSVFCVVAPLIAINSGLAVGQIGDPTGPPLHNCYNESGEISCPERPRCQETACEVFVPDEITEEDIDLAGILMTVSYVCDPAVRDYIPEVVEERKCIEDEEGVFEAIDAHEKKAKCYKISTCSGGCAQTNQVHEYVPGPIEYTVLAAVCQPMTGPTIDWVEVDYFECLEQGGDCGPPPPSN